MASELDQQERFKQLIKRLKMTPEERAAARAQERREWLDSDPAHIWEVLAGRDPWARWNLTDPIYEDIQQRRNR